MKTIHFIRHAESQANAGEATQNDESIQLTGKGKQQAIALANSITEKPGLIICSKFLRTQQTAAPLKKKFPGVRVKILPLHEFTYLSPAVCAGPTPKPAKKLGLRLLGTGRAGFFTRRGRGILPPIYPTNRPLPAMPGVLRSTKYFRFYPRARPPRHMANTDRPQILLRTRTNASLSSPHGPASGTQHVHF